MICPSNFRRLSLPPICHLLSAACGREGEAALVGLRSTEMSEGSRTSDLDYVEDNDDVLSKSWDVESRYRLQENALKLQGESQGAEVFRAQVELGLHEVTAALSSLR